jgi:hypothetical protein
MNTRPFIAALGIAAAGHMADARATSSPEIDELRDEIASLRSDYEARIHSLEARLAAAEAAGQNHAASTTRSAPLPVENIEPAATASGSAPPNSFNPAASLILSGTYGYLQPNPDKYQVGGFFPAGEGDQIGRGFNLGESELTLSANVDPYFSGYFAASYDPNGGVEVEESYLSHVGLIPGATLKFGRFLSAVGYHNEVHAHAWDFVNAPLVYDAFFDTALKENGLQARWLAPTDVLLEVGVEAGSGSNFPGSDKNTNSPNSVLVFVHVGGDVGYSNSYLIGASYRHSRAQQRSYEDLDAFGSPVTNAFHGDTDLWGAEFLWKWSPDGNPLEHNFKLQAEYFYRNENGSLAFDLGGPRAASGPYDGEQGGWYLQAIYQFMPRWRVGVRYDALNSGNVGIGLVESLALTPADFPLLADNDPTRVTTMIDFAPSEFSRLRLQYAWDSARFSGDDQQLVLQYIMSLGTHGAHKF